MKGHWSMIEDLLAAVAFTDVGEYRHALDISRGGTL